MGGEVAPPLIFLLADGNYSLFLFALKGPINPFEKRKGTMTITPPSPVWHGRASGYLKKKMLAGKSGVALPPNKSLTGLGLEKG